MYGILKVWAVTGFKTINRADILRLVGSGVQLFTLILIVSLYFIHQYKCVLVVYWYIFILWYYKTNSKQQGRNHVEAVWKKSGLLKSR